METRIGIREAEEDMVQLPSCFTKRQLYERYCFSKGWLAKSSSDGSYPPLSQYTRRPHDDDNRDALFALWPVGSESGRICAWPTFLRIWDKYLPLLKIRPPSLDTCLTCHVFRNRSKYNVLIGRNQHRSQDLICPETNEPSLLATPADEDEDTLENIILEAVRHVKAAQAQKRLAKEKIELAKASHLDNSTDSSVVTLVVDFCQNLDLPHLGGDQPGDTYYYSPIWLYCLGVVNVAHDHLYAYVYQEKDGKKGSNNVASMLMHYIQSYVLNDAQKARYNCPKQELNIIMDNCGGQNKNGTTIKLAAYLCEKNCLIQ